MTEFRIDWQRNERTGLGEAVLCQPKSAAQIDAILAHALELDERLLLTRLGGTQVRAARRFRARGARLRCRLAHCDSRRHSRRRAHLAASPSSRAALPMPPSRAKPSARSRSKARARRSSHDVGVAGLWRLMERIDEIRRHRVVIAVAGMEGALFSVLAGLVPCAVLAVPTSVGYGVGAGGETALNAALASCASGLAVVNIDNGFGAAHAALRMLGVARSA